MNDVSAGSDQTRRDASLKGGTEAPAAPSGRKWGFEGLRRITTASHRYIAEVDGLRFIAIFAVIFCHVHYMVTHVAGVVLTHSRFDFLVWPFIQGFRGVQLFFVISGFILGLPFADHYIKQGPAVKVGRYYLRRLTRLEPPYVLALLMFYAVAVAMHNVHTREPGFMAGLPLRLGYAYLLVRDQLPTLNGVTWTLEIEVQFYLLAPLFAKVFKLGTRPRRWVLIAAILGAPLLARVVPRSDLTLPGFVQYFLIGFLLADIHAVGAGAGWLSARTYDWVGISCLIVVAMVPNKTVFLPFLPWLLGGVSIAALRGGWFTAVLRRPAISVLGGMCYSLYLLHNPLLSFIATKIVRSGMSLSEACVREALVGVPVSVGAGIAYYILIERPCMNPGWPQLFWRRASRMLGVKPR